MTEEGYVNYKQAAKLKQLEFSGEATGKFCDCPKDPTLFHGMLYQSWNLDSDELLAPTLSQVQKWLRETKCVEVVVEPRFSNYKRIGYDWVLFDDCSGDYTMRAPFPFASTYEGALSAGIDAALELIE